MSRVWAHSPADAALARVKEITSIDVCTPCLLHVRMDGCCNACMYKPVTNWSILVLYCFVLVAAAAAASSAVGFYVMLCLRVNS